MATRLTAIAKRAVAEEIIRMTGRPETDIAQLLRMPSASLLDEFEFVQADWVAVPMFEWFGQGRPLWKIDPQEAWDRDVAQTQRVIEARMASA